MLTLVEYNRTLKRLLNKHVGEHSISPEIDIFIQAVNDSFNHFEKDRELLERALELTSSELTHVNEKIREEKRIVQERLTESEQILKSINENLREAVFRITAEGEIIYANHAFASLFDKEDDAAMRRINFKDLFEEEENWRDIKQRMGANGFVKGVEIRFKKCDGTFFWGLVSVMSSLGKGDSIFFDGSIVNITNQKLSEEHLRNTNLLLIRTNEELDRFVYSASHDLKAPLSSMLGLISVMALETPPHLEIYLDKMRGSIRKLDSFIKDIIDYSYNSRKTAVHEEINLLELFEESYDQYKYLPNAEKINMITEWKQTEPLFSDKRRIKIMFNNIISNAITYSNPRQEQSFIKITAETIDGSCLITIEDNGIGIGEEHLYKVFEMFYRGTDVSSGSGLGLYIVKETVHKLHGSISVTSALKVGTCFKIQLPNTHPVN